MLKMLRGGPRAIALVVSSNQASLYNIFTQAGSPTDPVAVMVTVNSGVVLQAGLTTGSGWVAGSTITIINNGTIAGIGGGDNAGIFGQGGFASSGTLSEGQNGKPGGDAVTLNWDTTIDNTGGSIFGGGGQGAGGGAAAKSNPPAANDAAAGGGGGGGRGYNNAAGAPPGNNNGTENVQSSTSGANGSSSSYGGAGVGGIAGNPLVGEAVGGNGARGGDWGEAGQNGQSGSFAFGGSGTAKPGGTGGPAGNSVRKNGKNLTWAGGNNSTQVKGAQT